MGNASRKLSFATGLVIGGFFLWLAVRNVNFEAVGIALKSANIWLVFPFLFLLALFYWLKAVRWAHLLRPTQHIPVRELVPAMMIGFAGNNILPIRLGELIRIYALGKQRNLSKSTVLGTVILERVFDLASILVLLTVALYLTPSASSEFGAARSFMIAAAVLAAMSCYGIVAAPKWMVAIVTPVFALVPDRLQDKIQDRLRPLQQGFAALTESPGHVLIKISFNSLVQWALLAACIHLAIMAFNVPAGPTVAVLILGLIVAGISLPSAPGFVGTLEYCFVLGLGFFGVGADLALSIGIYYHAITFISVTLSGAIALRLLDLSFGRVAKIASETRATQR